MTQGRDNAVQATFEVQGQDQAWRIISFSGTEEVSRLFAFELLLACDSASVDLSAVVGSQGLLTVTSGGNARHFHGLVHRLEQRESGRRYTVYSATLAPAAWRLTRRFDCRIFQKMGVRKIVKKVLDGAKVKHAFRSRGNQDPPERDYCVQYRESDWAFISRLLEEEGYFHHFEHGPDGHVLRITNDSTAAGELPGGPGLSYVSPDSEMPAEEHIFRLHVCEEIGSGKVTHTDYNFGSPSLDLRTTHDGARDMALEVYDYPGGHGDQTRGKALGQVRLEEARAQTVLLEGQSSAPRMVPGLCFKLGGHTRKELNGKLYFVTRVTHHGEKAAGDLEGGALDDRISYHNAFTCVPRLTPYRPPRATPRPVVQGAQTAVVVGPSTEEIYTDKHGRVKVQFHWDRQGERNQHSSCWVRVSQLWAGQGWGAMFIPRIGQEVIVDFLEGDPDRPIITGRVYHAQNPPPYELPAARTRSTIMSNSSPGGKGSNEIRFEDQKGSEEIYTHAEKDQNERVEHDMTTWVGNDQRLEVDRDRDKEIHRDETTRVGRDRSEQVDRHESITVTGNRDETVKGKETVSVRLDRVHTVTGNQQVTVRKDATLAVVKNETEKVGLNKRLTIGSAYNARVGSRMDLRVGTDMAQKVADEMTLTVGTRLEIVCGATRLLMEKDGKVTLSGKEFLFKVDGPFRTRARSIRTRGTSMTVKTSGPIKHKGSTVSEN